MQKLSWIGHNGCVVKDVGFGHLVAGIMGSNPTWGMNVCPHPSLLCCPVLYSERLGAGGEIKVERYKQKEKVGRMLARGMSNTGLIPSLVFYSPYL